MAVPASRRKVGKTASRCIVASKQIRRQSHRFGHDTTPKFRRVPPITLGAVGSARTAAQIDVRGSLRGTTGTRPATTGANFAKDSSAYYWLSPGSANQNPAEHDGSRQLG